MTNLRKKQLLRYLWGKSLIFGLSFCCAMAVFLWPSKAERAWQLRPYQKIVDSLGMALPKSFVLTFTAVWCQACHGQLQQVKDLWPQHDFSQGETQWWALNIDQNTAASLQHFWEQQALSLKLLNPNQLVQAALQQVAHWSIPLHLLVEQQQVVRILRPAEVQAYWAQHLPGIEKNARAATSP